MTQDEIIRMAQEAGFDTDLPPFKDGTAIALKLAALVASAERKECEKIIWNADDWIGSDAKIWIVKSIQEARGQA